MPEEEELRHSLADDGTEQILAQLVFCVVLVCTIDQSVFDVGHGGLWMMDDVSDEFRRYR